MILLEDKIYVNIEDLDIKKIEKIKKDLTITNPLWKKAAQLELSVWGKPQYLEFYVQKGRHFILPSGYINDLLRQWGPAEKPPQLIDSRFETSNLLNIQFKGILKPFQQVACDIALIKSFGVIQAPTGSGKTVCAIYLIVKRKQPTLILVDQIELGNQFVNKLIEFTNLTKDDIGFIGNDQFSIKPVTVALLQSMHRLDDRYYDEINKNIGQIICDETHIIAADTYYNVMTKLKAKYKIGLSATPKREDGLTQVIFWATGPIIYTVPFNDVSNIIKPEIVTIPTTYYFPLISITEYTDMITDLSACETRNQLIVDTVTEKRYKDLQKVLLCDRIMQVIILHKKLPGSDILISQISKYDKDKIKSKYGDQEAKEIFKKTSKKHRESIITRLNNETLTTLISTYGLFHKGIDIVTLEMAAFCAPIRSEVMVKQCRGRVMRKNKTKKAVIVDFVDNNIELLSWQAKARQKHLKDFK